MSECQKKVTTCTAETATRLTRDELTGRGDENHKIKCNHYEFNARNKHIFEEHIKIKHGRAEDGPRCNACKQVFNNNDNLKVNLVEQHTEEVDCSRCNAIFVKESDVYMHSNNCSGIISPNTCNKCEMNVVSRAALNKHESTCKGKEQLALYRNGDSCCFYKANKCNFFHPERRQNHQ